MKSKDLDAKGALAENDVLQSHDVLNEVVTVERSAGIASNLGL